MEQEVTRDYTSQLSEIDDPGLHHLVKRIRDHEIFHDALFKDLLAEVKEEQAHQDRQPSPPSLALRQSSRRPRRPRHKT